MDIQKIKAAVVKFAKDEEGLTMVEYAVAGSLVTLGAVAAFTGLGVDITAAIGRIRAAMAAP